MSALVSVAEGRMLQVARAVVMATPYAQVEHLLLPAGVLPAGLGPTARGLLEETLSKGIVSSLGTGGGWRRDLGQRLWERRSAAPLHFSNATVKLLQFLVKEPLEVPKNVKMKLDAPESNGDELFYALALSCVAQTASAPALARQPGIRGSALCWLVAPDALAEAGPLDVVPSLSLGSNSGLELALDGWQEFLAMRWARVERRKSQFESPVELACLGQAQGKLLEALFLGLDAAGHREWAGFALEAVKLVLDASPGLKGPDLVTALDPKSPLRDRTQARKSAGALLRAVVRLQQWDQEHRAVRFFDDEYEKAQKLVKKWESFGDHGFREAARLVMEIDDVV